MNLLIADDEPLEREVLIRIIDECGFVNARCFEAGNGADAVETVRREGIDVAIMDIKMPIMDGITAAIKIKAVQPACRVVFLTAYEPEDYQGVSYIKADAYLLKPAHPKEVKQMLSLFNPAFFRFSKQAVNEIHPVDKIKEHISKRISEELRLESLAEVVHLHPQYVSRLFKRKVGITLTEYIIRLRLEKSKYLLASTDLSVAQIGEQCGFPDSNYFSRIFRKREGIAPTEYRKWQRTITVLPPYQFQNSLF
ncbi:response regulator transcription factor [Aneurinibacillus thermoaerophilus]|uniref:response regulator transcription factor n=1 Tax=Aneurinibacillus thermoaerophilus TaxID=143495 RepID=UPI002E1D40A0|nr:helix-turn-helix domain-containing protein [Aneurinibacillus thermoaerophilus]MED0678093.1 AraC family transcriptional regulator [Aneurinibacillus thermoaerophilus]MED0737719.1 AraC family transcriptional regulator [Aneurinibacillus thermoaerophilus]MED0764177.1 AraC family transcriptional regulator [Aneurinibacillus thermoaerophilus]